MKKIMFLGDSNCFYLTAEFAKSTDMFIEQYEEAQMSIPSSIIKKYNNDELMFAWKNAKLGCTINKKYFLEFIDSSIANFGKPEQIIFVFGTTDINNIIKNHKNALSSKINEFCEAYVNQIIEISKKYDVDPVIVLPILPISNTFRHNVRLKYNKVLTNKLKAKKVNKIIDIFQVIDIDYLSEEFDPVDHHLTIKDSKLALNYICSIMNR